VPELSFALGFAKYIAHKTPGGVFHGGAESRPGGQVLEVEWDVVGLGQGVQVNVIESEQIIALKRTNGCHLEQVVA
jgi:hypothetical protein